MSRRLALTVGGWLTALFVAIAAVIWNDRMYYQRYAEGLADCADDDAQESGA